jgi:hypothetical protein
MLDVHSQMGYVTIGGSARACDSYSDALLRAVEVTGISPQFSSRVGYGSVCASGGGVGDDDHRLMMVDFSCWVDVSLSKSSMQIFIRRVRF